MTDLHQRTATELAHLIASGEASSREVLEAHINRAEEVNPHINAITVRMYDRAREEADAADKAVVNGENLGPLHGVPISIKDQFKVEGTPTTWGKPSRAGHRAASEGPLLHRLRNAGAIPFVKTNVPVLLIETETHNPVFGRTNNPWDPDRTPGGSSGGEGALIASRGSPFGLGADIGGSLRVPAHYSGIASLKPTAYRLPWGDNPEEDLPEWQESIFPAPGPMARDSRDVALGFRILQEDNDPLPREPNVPPVPWRDPADVDVSGLTVGYYEGDAAFLPSPAIRRAVREAVRALQDGGASVAAWTPPDGAIVYELYSGLLGGDGWRHLDEHLGDDPHSRMTRFLTTVGRAPSGLLSTLGRGAATLGQDSLAVTMRGAGTISVADYNHLVIRRRRLQEDLARQFQEGPDVIVGPPNGLPALLHDHFRDLTVASMPTFLPNLLAIPAGVVPVTRVRPDEESDRRPGIDVIQRLARKVERGSAGLPVGVQVMGPWWREDLVLAVMQAIEDRVEGVGEPPI